MIALHQLQRQVGAFVLGPLSLEVPEGAYVAIVGPSGHGKTTLLWTLAETSPSPLALVPQGGLLFPHLSVARNIGYARPRNAARIRELARAWGCEALLERRPGDLSGGEAMRVSIARALMSDPPLLLLDEPLSAIDEAGRAPLLALLRGLRGTRTIFHVTHDLDEAATLATHLGVLQAGKLAAFGAVDEILLRPPSAEVGRFLGLENMISGAFEPHGDDASLFRTRDGLTLKVLAHALGAGFVSIPERAVILSRAAPESSARNAIPGTIIEITADRSGARVVIEGEVRLAARMERESVAELGLVVGERVFAVVKAAQIRALGA